VSQEEPKAYVEAYSRTFDVAGAREGKRAANEILKDYHLII